MDKKYRLVIIEIYTKRYRIASGDHNTIHIQMSEKQKTKSFKYKPQIKAQKQMGPFVIKSHLIAAEFYVWGFFFFFWMI